MAETDDGGRSPGGGSTIAASEMDDHMTTHPSSPARADPDPRTSLQHVLAHSGSQQNTPPAMKQSEMTEDDEPTPGVTVQGGSSTMSASTSRKKKETAAGSGLNNAIYAGNKVRHLKKDDGEPLWRKDIQYDFLKLVFENDQRVFTNSYEADVIGPQTFANLYIDAMARSSKTSKILRDKLLSEHEPAKNMAMVCLLVNLGRMNTTLNCKCPVSSIFTIANILPVFPEMRAQLRTYHAIPSLQAHQDPNSYKQLQDAPRLKSILKGASEDRAEPNSLEKIKTASVPRTNPVNLIFVLAQFAPKVTELHLPPQHDFYDLIMRTSISSESRARAFLWLMWFYLESDFTEEGADENPFGAGVEYDPQIKNQGVPRFDYLNEEQEEAENIDTPEEVEYGQAKMRERKRIIEADQAAFQAEHGPPKRGPKPKLNLPPDDAGLTPGAVPGRIRPKYEDNGASPAGFLGRIRPKYESDLDSTRSTPPPRVLGAGGMRIHSVLNTGKGRNSLKHQVFEGSSPIPHHPEGTTTMRRPRPLTAHQLAVEKNRNQRVDYILSRGLRKAHHIARKRRKQEGPFYRAMARASMVQDPFDDSEGEEFYRQDPHPFRERGFVGLVQLQSEEDDFGEETAAYAAAFRRMGRRLNRWEAQKNPNLGVVGTNRVLQPKVLGLNGHDGVRDNDETEDEKPVYREGKRDRNGDVNMEDEDLDDMEKEILGLGSGEEEEMEVGAEADEDLDDVEKELLGLGGEETEEDESM